MEWLGWMKWQNSCITTYSMQFLGASRSRLLSVMIPLPGKQDPHLVSIVRIRNEGGATPYFWNTGYRVSTISLNTNLHMKHSPSHPVGPKPHLDNMVPNALNVGLPDLQTKGPIPGYGSGKLLVCKLLVEKSASHTLSLRVRPPLHYFHSSHAGSVNILIPLLQVRYLICWYVSWSSSHN